MISYAAFCLCMTNQFMCFNDCGAVPANFLSICLARDCSLSEVLYTAQLLHTYHTFMSSAFTPLLIAVGLVSVLYHDSARLSTLQAGRLCPPRRF